MQTIKAILFGIKGEFNGTKAVRFGHGVWVRVSTCKWQKVRDGRAWRKFKPAR